MESCVQTIYILEYLMLSSSPQNRVNCQQCILAITYHIRGKKEGGKNQEGEIINGAMDQKVN